MSDASDVVVIGGGTNGLIAAAYLARGGLGVTVLEESEIPGGSVKTEELTVPGFRHDTASSIHLDLMFNPLIAVDELGLLADHGLRYERPDPMMVIQLGRDEMVMIPSGADQIAATIAEFSEADAEAYREMIAEWKALVAVRTRRLSGPPGAVRDVDAEGAAKLDQISALSGLAMVAERFVDERTRELILAPALVAPLQRPGTGYVPMHFAGALAQTSWPLPVGGSGSLPRALISSIESDGGRVICGRLVERIVVEGGRAAAVLTAGDERFAATRAVVSSAHAIHLAQLLGPGHMPDELEKLSSRWKVGRSALAVDLALPRIPAYRTRSGTHEGVVGLFGTSAGIAAQHGEDIPAGRLSGPERWMQVMCPVIVDPSRAPADHATLKLSTSAPYALEGDPASWESHKHAYADQLVSVFANAVEGFSPGDELGRLVRSPVDLRRMNRVNEGGLQGGDMTPDQAGPNRPAPGWAAYRMPVAGLYQTGGSTHPGGGVNGWSGRNAARAVLDDLGIEAESFMSEVG